MAEPLSNRISAWQEYWIMPGTSLPTGSSYTCVVEINGIGEVFRGKVYKLPYQDYFRFNPMDIVTPYLHQDLDGFFASGGTSGTWVNNDAFLHFTVTFSGVAAGDYAVLMNYDYGVDYQDLPDPGYVGPGDLLLSEPIDNYYPTGVYVFNTLWKGSPAGYQTTYNLSSAGTGCAEYALYYVGLRGGWNTLVPQGTTIRKDKNDYSTIQRTYDPIYPNQHQTERYKNEITTSYVLNTGYLNDEQSANLARNLLSSNMVYLHNLNTNEILPVIITNSDVVYQTYQTNGKKLSQYQINVTESRTKIRR